MRLAIAFALGAVAASVAWRATAHVFAQPLFARRNYRGSDVPVGVGVLLAVSALTVEALLSAWDTVFETVHVDRGLRSSVLAVALGFSLLGLLDDVAAVGDDRGFKGHLRAMAGGRLTTGGLKLVGGGLLAVVVASARGGHDLPMLLVDALLIALGANLGNLFDRAPGRTTKVGLAAGLALVLSASGDDRAILTGVAVVLGAALGLLPHDLGERLMLGDAGSNVVGAVVATGVVATSSSTTRVVVLVAVLALNLLSEKVSFSRVIESVAPLRALDRLGRRS